MLGAPALRPSRLAKATALDGSDDNVLDPVDGGAPARVPPTVKVEVATGQMPPLVQDLK